VLLQLQDYDPYEENPGTGPFSEPETQIMRKLALTFDPHIWVNVHSGMEVSGPKKHFFFHSLSLPTLVRYNVLLFLFI
jgi:hypothetical protein